MRMGEGMQGLSKAYIFRAVEDSLRRLKTDYIDLYQSHRDDPDTPLEETLNAYAELIRQGKVRAIGASNYEAPRLLEALEISKRENLPRYESLQPLYNLYDRADYEGSLEALCRQHGLGVITYFSLASGFLTGKYRATEDLKRGGARGDVRRPISDAARRENSPYSGRGRGLSQERAGVGRSGMADGATRYYRSDRECHELRAIADFDRCRAPRAQPRRARGARPGERLALSALRPRPGSTPDCR